MKEIVVPIQPTERAELTSLFIDYRGSLSPIIDSVLQGHCGLAYADAKNAPKVAQLKLGFFTCFGGQPATPTAQALIEAMNGFHVVLNPNKGWRRAICCVHRERISDGWRTSFSTEPLDLNHLRHLMAQVPTRFQIQRIDLNLAKRIRADVNEDLLFDASFDSPEDFVKRGIGFCATTESQIVCGATSAIVCNDSISIQVNTNKPYRRMGLATAVSAALIAECLQRGITPYWDTDTPSSTNLAKKLGYVPDFSYMVLELD